MAFVVLSAFFKPATEERHTMATELKALDDMFHDMLKDVYYAEKQVLNALPKMAKATKSPELKKAFETHKGETAEQIERLSQVFDLIGKSPRAKTCDAILGILKEGCSHRGLGGQPRPRRRPARLGAGRRAL